MKYLFMQNKSSLKQLFLSLLLFFCLQLFTHTTQAQGRRAEAAEMKDTINLLISTIRSEEKAATPDKKRIDAARERLMVLLIYNNNKECGLWPSPSEKMEVFEAYWKCVFDNAGYGRKFVLSY